MKKIKKTTKPQAKKQTKKKASIEMARFEYKCPASIKRKLQSLAKKSKMSATAFLTMLIKEA